MADEKNCEECGKPGGRVIIDPYREELTGERVKMRLHAACADRRREDI